MALQIRRGTNAERLAITPLAGELIYVTDTKQLYVGDGTTAGGTTATAGTIDSLLADTTPQLGGELDLNGNNITGTGNIDITGTITASGNIIANGNITLGNGIGGDVITIGGTVAGNLVPNTNNLSLLGAPDAYWREAWIDQLNVGNQITASRVNASIIADDSTVVFDATSGTLAASQLTGTATINTIGTHTGTFDGDMTGSVFADDSTVIVDGVNASINTNLVLSSGQKLVAQKTGPVEPFEFRVIGKGNTTGIRIVTQSDTNLSGTFYSGKLFFGYQDPTGENVTAAVLGAEDSLYVVANSASDFSAEASYLTWQQPGKLGVGTYTPAEELDVRGNAVVTGFVQFGSLTTTERNALTAAAGMVIWNSTTTQFEGFDGTNWINLVDGVVSA